MNEPYCVMLWVNRTVFAWSVLAVIFDVMQRHWFATSTAFAAACLSAATLFKIMPRWRRSIEESQRIEAEIARECMNLEAVAQEWIVP
jgi:hypothetical protein